MTGWALALELYVARTRHERMRVLCGAAHPDHAAYRALVVREAAGEPHPPEPPADVPPADPPAARRGEIRRQLRLLKFARSCPYREQTCGCNAGKCWAGRGSNLLDPTRLDPGDCVRCLGGSAAPAPGA